MLDLLTLIDTVWIAPGNWIVQDIIPGQYVDNLTFLGVDPFTIPSLYTRLTDEIVTVENDERVSTEFALEQNYPNPFNPSTNLRFRVADRGFVNLKVFDILGNEAATLVNENKQAGDYEVEFNASNLSSGIYFYKLEAGNYTEMKKMVLLR